MVRTPSILACENLNFARKPVKVLTKEENRASDVDVARNSSGPGSVISNAKSSAH